MKNIINKIKLETGHPTQVIDITDRVRAAVSESGVAEGTLTIITQHTTAAININERDEGLQRDMVRFLSSFVPKDADYIHNRNSSDGRANAHSHLMAIFSNASLTIPVANGAMLLGDWQSIFLIELDGPRKERTVIVQITGE